MVRRSSNDAVYQLLCGIAVALIKYRDSRPCFVVVATERGFISVGQSIVGLAPTPNNRTRCGPLQVRDTQSLSAASAGRVLAGFDGTTGQTTDGRGTIPSLILTSKLAMPINKDRREHLPGFGDSGLETSGARPGPPVGGGYRRALLRRRQAVR